MSGNRGLTEVNDSNWRSFLDSPVSALLLTTSNCPHCRRWKDQLEKAMQEGRFPDTAGLGVVIMDGEEVEDFRRENAPWLEQVQGVPFTAIFVEGEPRSSFYGEGMKELEEAFGTYSPSP